MVNTDLSLSELITCLRDNLSGANQEQYRSFTWSGNWIRVWENEDFELSPIQKDDAFLTRTVGRGVTGDGAQMRLAATDQAADQGDQRGKVAGPMASGRRITVQKCRYVWYYSGRHS